MTDHVARVLQPQRATGKVLGVFHFLLADYTESKTHLLGTVNTCALAAHFTQSC